MAFSLQKFINKLSLQTVLTIPFMVQIVVAVGIVGYLSFRNGQNAVNDLANQLQSELKDRILQQLEATVERPTIINQINANSLRRGDIDVLTGRGEHQFWQQIQIFESTNLIYCATEREGAFLGLGRSPEQVDNPLHIQVANTATERFFYYYDVDSTGSRAEFRRQGDRRYEPRDRPWYQAAKRQKKATWSDVYLDFDTQQPTITANIPVFTSQTKQLIGVCATDIILSEELSTFLQNLKISQSGIAFILEPKSGALIASSTTESITVSQREATELIQAAASHNALIRQVTRKMIQRYADLATVESQSLALTLNRQRHYLQVVRFNQFEGLDWLVVLVIPEADFMAQIHKNTQITLILCLATVAITLLIGLLATQWLTQPIFQLSATAKEIANGHWEKAVELERADAIGDLSRSFARMARQLQASFTTLEKRIEERTAELVQLNRELQKLAHIDGLTQIANRRYFDYFFEREWQQLIRTKQPLTLILGDVDHFKKYNDTYGHLEGDNCLKKIANLLTEIIQDPASLVARYGGEEFILVLPNMAAPGAIEMAQLIAQKLHARQIPHAASAQKIVTMSLGIATMIPNRQTTPDSLIAVADLALYTAKSRGRNCYYVAPETIVKAETQTDRAISETDTP